MCLEWVRDRTRSHNDCGMSTAWVTSAWKPKGYLRFLDRWMVQGVPT